MATWMLPIWETVAPTRVLLFAWQAMWLGLLMLDRVWMIGMPLVNRCFLYQQEDETVDHI